LEFEEKINVMPLIVQFEAPDKIAVAMAPGFRYAAVS
jgi:hypothetical protein